MGIYTLTGDISPYVRYAAFVRAGPEQNGHIRIYPIYHHILVYIQTYHHIIAYFAYVRYVMIYHHMRAGVILCPTYTICPYL
jgi:hypothetical protein